MSTPQLHTDLSLPIDASDQNSNIRHKQSPAEPIEVSLQLRIQLISGVLRSIRLLILHRPSSMAAIFVHEMQNDTTAHHHVNDLSRNTSNKEPTTRIEKSHIAAIACRRDAGNGTSSDLNQNSREVRADEDVRVPLGLEFRVLLAAVEDDVLKYHRDGDGDERRSDEKAGELHGHCGRAVDGHVRRLLDCICWILLTSKDPDASSVGRRSL
jgi:hypothetical protein